MTVFEERVLLERRTHVDLQPGVTQVRLPGFPEDLDLARLQVRAQEARILSMKVVREAGDGSPEASADREVHMLRGRVEGTKALLALLDELEPAEAAEALAPDAYWAATERVLDTRARAEADLRALVVELERAEQALQAARARPSPRAALELRLRAAAPVRCRVDVVADAGFGTWRPSYVLAVDEGQVLLEEFAEVLHSAPSGGESACLELAGGPPPGPPAPPARAPWIVRSERPYEERSAELYRGPRDTAARLVEGAARGRPGEDARPGPGFTLEGRFPRGVPTRVVDGPVPVEAGRLQVRVRTVPVEARFIYCLRPAVDPRAFGRIVLTPRDGVLPQGRATLFIGGLHRGSLPVPDGSSATPWAIDLGPEPALVGRREVRTELRVEGLLQREDVHVVHITLEVESGLDRPAELRVEDQVPIAVDPRLRVRLVRTFPATGQVNPKSGVVTFPVELAAEGRARLSLAYEIDAPHDYRLVQALGESG